MDELVKLFRALSDPNRLRIILSLREGEKNVTALCEEMDVPQPTVSHHLGLLRAFGVVHDRRCGKQVFYSLAEAIAVRSKRGRNIIEFTAASSTVRVAG